jgi:hypothetical protein
MAKNSNWGVPPILILALKLQQYIKAHEQQTTTDKLKRATLLLERYIRKAKDQGEL